MAKRFQSYSTRYQGDQAGCIGGLISIFDFRHGHGHGRSTGRLLADRRRASKQVVGTEHSSTQKVLPHLPQIYENLTDGEEHKSPITDVAKTSVKELMEEEMFIEQGSKHQSNSSEFNLERNDSEYQNNARISRDNLGLEIIMQELAQSNRGSCTECTKDDFGIGLDNILPRKTLTACEEKIVAAVDLFIEQRLSKEGESRSSKEFVDALQTLSSNEGSFFKLLHDQNSPLVKRFQDLEDSRLSKDRTCSSFHAFNLSEERTKDLKSDRFSGRRHRNFFHRRSRSLDGDLSSISSHSPCKMDNRAQNVSRFSFTEIKRKLRQAIGKQRQEQNENSDDKCTIGENFVWGSSNRNHFYTERFAKSSTSFRRGEQVNKSKDCSTATVNRTSSNIYIEAKKHLSEMLKNGNEEGDKITRPHSPKSLGKILSFPDYSTSPNCSPRERSDDKVRTLDMILSPRGSIKNNVNEVSQENHSNRPSPKRQTMESQPCISGSSLEYSSSEIQSFTEDTVTPEVSSPRVLEVQETSGLRLLEEEKSTNSCSESSTNSVTGDAESGDIIEVDNEESASECLRDSFSCLESDLFGEFQILSCPPVSPTSSPVRREVEDSECAIDRTERPSPVSVLEPLFTDEEISPARAIYRPVEKEIQPRHLHFEAQPSDHNQSNCTRISLEDEESPFEYVEAVLLGSGLDWDEFLVRWISTHEILDPLLFNDVELFSGRPYHDQKLLFDCANEVLNELCESYFGYGKCNIWPVSKGMDLIREIWGRVEWRLLQHLMVCSLDQLVKTDMAGCGKWMNLQSDVEVTSFEIGEIIFDELVEETLLSFADCTSDIYDILVV